jgi:hypothetical protein
MYYEWGRIGMHTIHPLIYYNFFSQIVCKLEKLIFQTFYLTV